MAVNSRFLSGANPFSGCPVMAFALRDVVLPASPHLLTLIDRVSRMAHLDDLGEERDFRAQAESMADRPETLVGALSLALLRKSGVPVRRFGPAARQHGLYAQAWFEASDPGRATAALQAALTLARDAEADDEAIGGAIDHVDDANPAAWTELVLAAADRRGIPWRFADIPGIPAMEMGIGAQSKWFRQSFFEWESRFSYRVTQDKHAASHFLREMGVAVPRSRVIRTSDELAAAARDIGFPLVVKPLQLGGGRGLAVDVRDVETLSAAVKEAARFRQPIVIEEFVRGRDYRIVVIDGKAICCSHREPPQVVGDGRHTISQLCDIENLKPERGTAQRFPFRPIDIADLEKRRTAPFRAAGYTPESVPDEGSVIDLSYTATLREGARYFDVTDHVHRAYMRLAERIARLTAVKVCGIDLIAHDITAAPVPGNHWVNEVNSHPALRINHFRNREWNVADALLRAVFPEADSFRVPIAMVVSEGATPATLASLSAALGDGGRSVAVASGAGYRIDDEVVLEGDHATLDGSVRALGDRSAQAIILERRSGDLASRGAGIRAGLIDIAVFEPPETGANGFWQAASFVAQAAHHAVLAPGHDPAAAAAAGAPDGLATPEDLAAYAADCIAREGKRPERYHQ